MTKIEVTNKLKNSINVFSATLTSIPEKDFHVRADNKWSPAEQAEHLNLSVKPLLLAYSLPKPALRLLFGRPNRPGRDYATILDKYHNKLKSGGAASSPFIPKQLKTATNPEDVIAGFIKIHEKFIVVSSKWDDKQLDNYLLPHPLLGKITMREMLYFTDLHILHHNKLLHQYYL